MEGGLSLFKICGCGGMMKRIRKYENEAGTKFHTYQCSRCRGKIDYAQVELDGVRGEFSVHSNLNIKETKMANGKDTVSNEERSEPRDLPGGAKKESRPTNVNINIRFIDTHFQVTFRHEVTRIFHNMEEVLLAIDVEIKRLIG